MHYVSRAGATVDVPDAPATGGSDVARGADAPVADTHTTPDLGIGRADAIASVPTLTMTGTSPAHIDAPAQVIPVASAIADLPQSAVAHSDMTDASTSGSGEVGRGSDLASLDTTSSSYADHGWFVVPSADNEYGPSVTYAAADDYGWSAVAGEFSADWFIA